MNKQELIERIEGLKNLFGNKVECIEIAAVIELSSLKSQGSLPFSNLSIYSSRTSRGLLAMIKGTPLRQSSDHWMSWGMMSNGKCLTARILESPKTENECSLSDILEEQVGDKYFLSLKQEQINQLSN